MNPQHYDAALAQFQALHDGWNSYGGRPTSDAACDTIRSLIALIPDCVAPSNIVPTPQGGVQIEWHGIAVYADLEVRKDGKWTAWAEVPEALSDMAGENGGAREVACGWIKGCGYLWNGDRFDGFVGFLGAAFG